LRPGAERAVRAEAAVELWWEIQVLDRHQGAVGHAEGLRKGHMG